MKSVFSVFIFFCVVLLSGCTTTKGSFNPSTHFTYPNSNVVPLGYVSASVKDQGFIFPPQVDKEKIAKLMEGALAQKPGADMIINYKIDTTNTVIPIPIFSIHFQTIKLEGTAASMKVGKQELLSN